MLGRPARSEIQGRGPGCRPEFLRHLLHAARDHGPDHGRAKRFRLPQGAAQDRKSTRLNSSHLVISYAVFCLKKKKISNPTVSILHVTLFSHIPSLPTTFIPLFTTSFDPHRLPELSIVCLPTWLSILHSADHV